MQLIIEITQQSIAAFQLTGNEIQLLEKVNCTKRTDVGYKEVLTQVIEKIGNLDRFENFSCSYFAQEFCLVPNSLFSASTPETLLQYTVHKPISKSDVDYNRLPDWSSVIIYQLPMWVKSVLILKAPRIVIQHEIAHILRHLTTGSLIPLRSHLVIHEEQFSFVVRKDGNIAHTSIQEYQSEEDIVYHLATVFTQLKIESKNELYIHGTGEQVEGIQKRLETHLKKIKLFEQSKIEIQVSNHLQYQTLCV
ncbi:DUF3822 family protein [Fluviicola taffensis]|uniref:DUF3822 family protein n=1 Tax=Fluviicola taffensis TaxID=191579 RepID=UPI0031378D2D